LHHQEEESPGAVKIIKANEASAARRISLHISRLSSSFRLNFDEKVRFVAQRSLFVTQSGYLSQGDLHPSITQPPEFQD